MSDRLVARIWNEDGVEMPSLYERDGELICTWNYLLIVAPQFAFALKEIRRQPKGHNCPGYCRRMYALACAALDRSSFRGRR